MISSNPSGSPHPLGSSAATWYEAPTGWLYLLLGLGAVFQALGSPSRAALLPQIVGPEVFTNAVTWNSSVFRVASVTGPAIGGLLLGLCEASTAFVLVAFCRLLAFGAITGVRCRPIARATESVSWHSLAAGIRFVWKTKLILVVIGAARLWPEVPSIGSLHEIRPPDGTWAKEEAGHELAART